ncbi:IclR family transcriptional regulator [Microvirga sp. M2]|uniref:IclR family transcriptional regulator n=1 Tax=Microvirga sp. M2 TaxID=3073270 RepID=UPI0039C2DC49
MFSAKTSLTLSQVRAYHCCQPRCCIWNNIVSSLENGLEILSLLSKERPILRVGEVCRELGMPKSSVSRLLKTLSEYGFLERANRELGYCVGRRALALAELYLADHDLLDFVDVAMDALIHDFQFAAYTGILSGPDMIILKLKHGTYPLRLVHDIGKRMPAYPTAIGRALLARKSDDEAIELIEERAEGKIDRRIIRKELAEIRKTGVAMTNSTMIPGIAAFGVAVAYPGKDEMLGFSVSFPTTAADRPLQARMMQRIREEAHSIGLRLGDPYWSTHSLEPGSAPASSGKTKEPASKPKKFAEI